MRALSHLNLLHGLPALFSSVIVPPAVATELRAPHARTHSLDVESLSFVKIQTPAPERVADLERELDRGEAEAIALALELHATLLIDEAAGRRVSDRLGLTCVGTLGVLGRAKGKQLTSAVRPLIDRLRSELNFFVALHLVERFLQSIGE
jgi:hypothetical protein